MCVQSVLPSAAAMHRHGITHRVQEQLIRRQPYQFIGGVGGCGWIAYDRCHCNTCTCIINAWHCINYVIHTHTRKHICTHTHTWHTHVHAHTHTHACTHTHMHTYNVMHLTNVGLSQAHPIAPLPMPPPLSSILPLKKSCSPQHIVILECILVYYKGNENGTNSNSHGRLYRAV